MTVPQTLIIAFIFISVVAAYPNGNSDDVAENKTEVTNDVIENVTTPAIVEKKTENVQGTINININVGNDSVSKANDIDLFDDMLGDDGLPSFLEAIFGRRSLSNSARNRIGKNRNRGSMFDLSGGFPAPFQSFGGQRIPEPPTPPATSQDSSARTHGYEFYNGLSRTGAQAYGAAQAKRVIQSCYNCFL